MWRLIIKADEVSTYRALKHLFEHAEVETVLCLADEPSWDDLLAIYAQKLAEVSERLTNVEVAGFAKIGISIARKSRSLPSTI